jgi:hypothetical protein
LIYDIFGFDLQPGYGAELGIILYNDRGIDGLSRDVLELT